MGGAVWVPLPYLASRKMRVLVQECTALGGTLRHLIVWLSLFFHTIEEIRPPP